MSGSDLFCPACNAASHGPDHANGTAPSRPAATGFARKRLLLTGKLLTSADEPVRSGAAILTDGDRIRAVYDERPPVAELRRQGSEDAEIVDLSDKFVLPGLIDCHVHLLFEGATGTGIEFFQKSDAHWAVDGAAHGRATLAAGFTTVRDCGNLNGTPAIFALRDAFADNRLPGPRVLAASAILTVTGGAGDMLGFRAGALPDPAHSGVADGVEECRRAVRRQVKAGADFVKVTMTGGILSDSIEGVGQQFRDEEIAAIVDEAHRWDRRVAVHAHCADGVNAALRAGADSIEHGTYLDDESIRLFAEHDGAWLVPTLLAGLTVTRMAEVEGLLPPAVRAKARLVGPDLQKNIGRAISAGVPIAFGTDSGVSVHGDNAREFQLLVEGGLTPLGAIRSATSSAARLLGIDQETGRIAPGLAADVVALDKDPLEDVSALCGIGFVLKSGRILDRSTHLI